MKPKRVLISVLRVDIRKGEPKNAENCPVARACKRKLPEYDARVEGLASIPQIVLTNSTQKWVAFLPMPKTVFNFATSFDAGKPMKPFSFYLSLPELPEPTQAPR
jgi:hypothetical protein